MNKNNLKSDGAILEIKNLSREVPVRDGAKNIIDSFSFSFHPGNIYTLVGPSGSGKTSLLRLLNRLDERTGGDIYFHEQDISSYPVTSLRRKIALTFQIPYLFENTVSDNLEYGIDKKSKLCDEDKTRLLEMVGLEKNLCDRNPAKLSVGQQQRVALARSLALEPEILLLDEPTSALDLSASRTIEELILNLNKELNITICMVTHNFEQALRLDGISLFMVEGKLIETGKSAEMFANPKNEITKKFISGDLR